MSEASDKIGGCVVAAVETSLSRGVSTGSAAPAQPLRNAPAEPQTPNGSAPPTVIVAVRTLLLNERTDATATRRSETQNASSGSRAGAASSAATPYRSSSSRPARHARTNASANEERTPLGVTTTATEGYGSALTNSAGNSRRSASNGGRQGDSGRVPAARASVNTSRPHHNRGIAHRNASGRPVPQFATGSHSRSSGTCSTAKGIVAPCVVLRGAATRVARSCTSTTATRRAASAVSCAATATPRSGGSATIQLASVRRSLTSLNSPGSVR